MVDLPRKKSDRVAGETYNKNGLIVIWSGSVLHCEHNRRRYVCKECDRYNGSNLPYQC